MTSKQPECSFRLVSFGSPESAALEENVLPDR
jgi:hypothetical protein